MKKPQLVWFKKDLRIEDHAPFAEAASRGPVIALFVYEDEIINAPDYAGRHHQFLNECLEELNDQLSRLGGYLLIQRGNLVQVLQQLHEQTGFEQIWSHEETGNAISYRRDIAVSAWCRENRIGWNEIPQTGVVRRLGNRDGWAGRWAQRMNAPIIPAPPNVTFYSKPESLHLLGTSAFSGIASDSASSIQQGGRKQALQLQRSFLTERGAGYRKEMSSPLTAEESCSRLSPYFTFGCLSIREAYQTARDYRAELYDRKKDGQKIAPGWFGSLKSYLGRLRWHCHFMQKLEDEPSIEFSNFSRVYDGLRENEWNEEWHQAWCEGQTGYPLIDAVMRCLNETGWINFRMRAMVMSFSSYHLWNHWREPSLHLARVFTDYEPGIHYSQAQMQSGVTGINTIRIYSPIKQAADQDPQGEFIKRWIPELEGVPIDLIAEPHKMTSMEQMMFGCDIGKQYPKPIVEHAIAYKSAQSRMFAARGTKAARIEAGQVQKKHGSRKRSSRAWR